MLNKITFYINGKKTEIAGKQSELMLSDYLRYEACLTGTKVVCAEGDCGACSVLRFNPLSSGEDSQFFNPLNSCIMPVSCLHGSHLITIEALKDQDRLHEAQRSIYESHAAQCGFCTPGFVMALAGLCEEKLGRGEADISEQEAKNSMTGNLCRCTGYDSLIKAGKEIDLKNEKSLSFRYHSAATDSDLKKITAESLYLENESFRFFAPTTYAEAFYYLHEFPDVRIIASGTDLGVVHNKRKIKLINLMSLHLIKESYKIQKIKEKIEVGPGVNLTQLRHFLKIHLQEYANYLDIFASPQIKNSATLIGNIANASPIGDNAPVLLALDGKITLESLEEVREIPLRDYFLDYKKTQLKKGELITKISFSLPKKSHFKLFKNSLRKDLDISTVNMAFWAKVENRTIENIRIGAGGIAGIPLRLYKVEKFLKGKKISLETVEKACELAQTEFNPLSDVRATSSYRRVVVSNFIRRFLSDSMEESL